MEPLFKTDVWTVANAAGGKRVEVQLHAMPSSTVAYADRLKLAGEYLGLERINIFYDGTADLYRIGGGSARLSLLPVQGSKVEIRQFADDDLTSLVDGRDILDRANEMLDTIDEGDDFLGEHIFYEDDENDSYRFKR
jgi:hypothetical protein